MRKSKLLRIASAAAVILGITWSCHTDEPLELRPEERFLSIEEMEGMTRLGRKLENPYSVENMKKALERLKASNPNGRTAEEAIEVVTTHLYIRFKPKDEAELDILKNDSTLVLYDYPLDHEIEESGDFYHDPSIPADQPTYQYCAVKVDKQLPIGVEHEVLEELFIPDEDSDDVQGESTAGRVASSGLIDALVDQSLVLTGNLAAEDASSGGDANARRSKWRPAGTIRVWDDTGVPVTTRRIVGYDEKTTTDHSPCYTVSDPRPCPTYVTTRTPIYEETTTTKNWVGVEGVEVRARRWFTAHKGFANRDGRFACNGTFRRDANYSLKWERNHYSIRSGSIGQAKMDGPKKRGDWNVDILDNHIQQFYAFIHLGAHHYYYGNILGLSRPPLNSLLKPQMKIGGFDKDGRANHNDDRRYLGIRNQVRMYRIQSGSIASTERLYNTILHELAHASHWEFRKGDWDGGRTSGKLQESWAMGVAWSLTRLRYPNHNWWANVDFEWMRSRGKGENQYTSLIIDLIDNENQGLTDRKRPFDRVDGYTIAQIEAAISNSNNILALRDNIRNRYPNNPDRAFLVELFEQYINLAR